MNWKWWDFIKINKKNVVKSSSGDVREEKRENTLKEVSFSWIEKEELLREEGAIYGFANCGLVEKQNVIKAYYERKIAMLEIKVSKLLEMTQMWQEDKDKYIKRLEDINLEVEGRTNIEKEDIGFPYRHLISTIAYSAILVFSFWSTCVWVGKNESLDLNPIITTLGVFLFGSLSLLGNRSTVYYRDKMVEEDNRRENWKIYAEEYGIPFVCALFILFSGPIGLFPGLSFAFAAFLFFVFVFVGKGLLMSIVILTNNQKERRLLSEHKHKALAGKEAFLEEQNVLHVSINEINKNLTYVKQEANTVEQKIAELKKMCAAKVAYFTSEYELARRLAFGNQKFESFAKQQSDES